MGSVLGLQVQEAVLRGWRALPVQVADNLSGTPTDCVCVCVCVCLFMYFDELESCPVHPSHSCCGMRLCGLVEGDGLLQYCTELSYTEAESPPSKANILLKKKGASRRYRMSNVGGISGRGNRGILEEESQVMKSNQSLWNAEVESVGNTKAPA